MNHSSQQPQVLELEEIFCKLEEKGKETYGKAFKLYKEHYKTIFKLMIYLYRDQHHAEKYGIDLRKGLLLTGPVACGKTTLLRLINHLQFPAPNYHLISTREICLQFMESGHTLIKQYGATSAKQRPVFCFDDLGTETAMKYFGNETNVMAEIMLLRYDLYIHKGIPTHITTSLSASELEKHYGSRVRTRMREMFNLIPFANPTLNE
jgi:energy-coupling factor transporter ATP-binding protein EcfA2